jgi:methylenetetrahydrofolate reductase (NADPH)
VSGDSGLGSASGIAGILHRLRFELVPLKGAEEQAVHLPRGATVTVTSSPRRGLEPTIELCERLAVAGFSPVPHVSARLMADRAHLGEVTSRLVEAGVREVFVIGGDGDEAAGPFDSALSLLRALAESGRPFDRVGVAGYPERHPRIPHEALLQALLDKQPFASYVVSQICFDPWVVAGWLDRVRRAGVGLPVYLAMPGAMKRAKLVEISLRIGVGDSLRFVRRHGGLVAKLVGRGAYRPDTFLAGLPRAFDGSGPTFAGLHINTFNQVESTIRWLQDTLTRNGWPVPLTSEESLA